MRRVIVFGALSLKDLCQLNDRNVLIRKLEMDKNTVHQIYKHVCELVVSVGEYVKSADKSRENLKTDAKGCYADLVTEFDQNTEKMLVSDLSSAYPGHKFIGEEATADGAHCNLTDDPTWIIDPIDGTTNFVHGYPQFCISIALYVNKEAMIGIVYDIPKDRFYSAIKGEGAYCNGRIIKCSAVKDLEKCLVATEFGSERDPAFLQFKIDNMTKIISKIHGIRCAGSAALNICGLASGHTDAYYEFGPHIWDFAAAQLIAKEAGATVTAPNGTPFDLHNRKILVTCTPELSSQLSSLLGDFDLQRD